MSTAETPVAPPCGCEEHERSGLSRRHLLSFTAAAGMVTATTLHNAHVAFGATPSPTPSGSRSPSMSPSPSASASASASARVSVPTVTVGNADVLVVLSLRGGFDGLSAIVPAGDANYYRARPNIAVPASAVKKIDATFGLAPGLKALYPLWDAGKVAAVHSVGQQNPTHSHFEDMANMERAAPGTSQRDGYLNRFLGRLAGADAFAGAQVGNTTMPASLYGESSKFAVSTLRDIKIGVGEDLVPIAAWSRSMAQLHKGARPDLVKPTTDAIAAVGKLKSLPPAVEAAAAGYPNGQLGGALHDVARLIKANLGLRVATIDMGNYDMHQNLGGATGGWMFNQLTELSTALAAFAKELGNDFNRVTLVTMSEFGRRVSQNGSGGVDHGHGNAVLVMGGGVNGGKVYGRWPGLAPSAQDNGNLAALTDYRAVMSEIMTRRCGISTTTEIFPGFKPNDLGVLKPRST